VHLDSRRKHIFLHCHNNPLYRHKRSFFHHHGLQAIHRLHMECTEVQFISLLNFEYMTHLILNNEFAITTSKTSVTRWNLVTGARSTSSWISFVADLSSFTIFAFTCNDVLIRFAVLAYTNTIFTSFNELYWTTGCASILSSYFSIWTCFARSDSSRLILFNYFIDATCCTCISN